MAKQIVWKDLPKHRGLFTRRSVAMLSLDNGTAIQYYSANTKINVTQEAIIDGVKYFRTESAASKGLNWAFKATSFDLPKDELASLEPSKNSLSTPLVEPDSKPSANKNKPKTAEPSKSEEKVTEDRKRSLLYAFKRFFRKEK